MNGRRQMELQVSRLHVVARGAVQGVGFRPFVYRLATELHLNGWVRNTGLGVIVEVEGVRTNLDVFLSRLEQEKPPRAFIQSLESTYLDPAGFSTFEILESDGEGDMSALVLPDIATCPDCLREIFDPLDRRYLYPFTNCTNCGPRFSIIEALPYDRSHTSMRQFTMCRDCQREYDDPADRRFHAQPNACPRCGPHLELWDGFGKFVAAEHSAILHAIVAMRRGEIVALKGIGGFHLLADALNEDAVRRLRQRKHREEKPFALMFPSIDSVENQCSISALERRLLLSPESPIVLLKRKRPPSPSFAVASSVAPDNPYLGVMLPYSPLHHILMRELTTPVVDTSGNLSEEPICIDEHEAVRKLKGIADFFLVHNRPIVRHVDDSIVRISLGREMILRRARGYAPLPVTIERNDSGSMLAVGGHLKNSVALTVADNVFISQHIGDLETAESYEAFQNVITSFRSIYRTNPERIIADLHPDYLSTQYARKSGLPVTRIQHHYAHVASCMAENRLDGTVLGVSWDGTGFGPDGTVWGGEFLLTEEPMYRRVATFRTFPLPGNEKAIREPWRAALGLLYEIFGTDFVSGTLPPLQQAERRELDVLQSLLTRNFQSPRTSSVGRLFDAVSSLIGLRHVNTYEGQAAAHLEFAIDDTVTNDRYDFCFASAGRSTTDIPPLLVVDWEPMILQIIEDVKDGLLPSLVSAKFHNTLVEIILETARRVAEPRVVLSGGCFQNAYLLERSVVRLRTEGFHPYWHQRVPTNDGGLSLGQIYAARRLSDKSREPTKSRKAAAEETTLCA